LGRPPGAGRGQDRVVRGGPGRGGVTDGGAGPADAEARLDISRRAIEQLEGARELVGARFGVVLPAGSERATVHFVGLERHDFAEPPAVGRAPVLAGALVTGQTLRIDDVAVWAPSEEAARSYGILSDGRLVRSWLAAPVPGRDGAILGVVY